MNALENRIRVISFLEQDDPFHRIRIVDNRSVGKMRSAPNLPKANLRSLIDGGNILHPNGCAVCSLDDGVLNILHAPVKAQRLNIHLLRAFFDEAATAIRIVVCGLLLDLAQRQAVGDELIRIKLDLVFLRRPAKAGDIHNSIHAFEGLLKRPVFDGLLLHHVIVGIGALDRVPENLTNGAPVRSHLRREARRQIDLTEPLQHMLAIDVAG